MQFDAGKRLHIGFFVALAITTFGQSKTHVVPVDSGWSNNSVNATVFRKSSIASYRDSQFVAFYSNDKHVIMAKRKLGSDYWIRKKTNLTGNPDDAHNIISIALDGQGYLHVAWSHHNTQLRYTKSKSPLSLEFENEQPMTGSSEEKVTYPEFYRLPNGNLMFLYRDGSSGNGNLILKRYDVLQHKWNNVQENLINGEGKRNAYWQGCVDSKGTIHLSWVWRESPDVASNHDLCYARSYDEGITWQKSTGEKYALPITERSAEYIAKIPQQHELINQTSMTADEFGRPFIASYWRDDDSLIPQYHIAFILDNQWEIKSLSFRLTPFTLSGGGTKRIPISRPQLIVSSRNSKVSAALIFRDEERGSKVSAAVTNNLPTSTWKIEDLYELPVGQWEPSFDIDLWREKKLMHLFVQKVEQLDSEGTMRQPGTPVYVLEWKPFK